MQEQNRVVRAYSEDTERPYYQIRYRLSLTGRDLLADVFGSGAPARGDRSESVCTTISHAHDLGNPGDRFLPSDANMMDFDEAKVANSRVSRSRSLEGPSDNSNIADLKMLTSKLPGTPRSSHRKTHDQSFQFRESTHNLGHGDDMEVEDPVCANYAELRRTKSVGTAAELQMNRGAPAMPVESLHGGEDHLKGLKQVYPQFACEFQGLVTCLNSKNVRKYRVGQSYRKGVIVGIDEDQAKIIVLQKNMPVGTLVVMRTDSPSRYEKGYSVQDVQGRMIGSVHAIDRAQRLLVINTSSANPGTVYHSY